jgi:anti-sigma B factor antagonist
VTATSRSQVGPAGTDELMSVETVGLDEFRAHVKVTGDVDVATGAPLWAVLHGHLGAGRRFLRLDMSGVGFLDASGLSGIAQVHHAALDQRGTLVLTGVSARVARLLRLTGLDDVLFVGGTRGGDDVASPAPGGKDGAAAPGVWPGRSVPWTPLAAVRDARQPRGDRRTSR